jgi:tRNA threonylcarbamoyladenosine biosynthesis protein TsaE
MLNRSVAPLNLHLRDEDATRALGAELAKLLGPNMSIHLSGELGSGKTTIARGLIQALGFPGRVRSPTYTLVEPYANSKVTLFHFDFFRLDDPVAWEEAGFRECFDERSIRLIEWPERARGLLPPPDLRIALAILNTGGRIATIDAATKNGRACLAELARARSVG